MNRRRGSPFRPARSVSQPLHVLAFHKALGLITTHRDELGRETVYDRLLDRLPDALRRLEWHAVGRLDKDTSGLLLFTNDGRFLSYATQPGSELVKTYRVLAKGLWGERQIDQLMAGVELTGGVGFARASGVRVIEHRVATSWVEIDLTEGKNREVRRMLLAIGSQAIRLQRISIGSLALDIEEDEWRELTREEIRGKLGYVPE